MAGRPSCRLPVSLPDQAGTPKKRILNLIVRREVIARHTSNQGQSLLNELVIYRRSSLQKKQSTSTWKTF
jgi:hypothetical protein